MVPAIFFFFFFEFFLLFYFYCKLVEQQGQCGASRLGGEEARPHRSVSQLLGRGFFFWAGMRLLLFYYFLFLILRLILFGVQF